MPPKVQQQHGHAPEPPKKPSPRGPSPRGPSPPHGQSPRGTLSR